MHLQLDLYSDLPARPRVEFINFALYLNISQFWVDTVLLRNNPDDMHPAWLNSVMFWLPFKFTWTQYAEYEQAWWQVNNACHWKLE